MVGLYQVVDLVQGVLVDLDEVVHRVALGFHEVLDLVHGLLEVLGDLQELDVEVVLHGVVVVLCQVDVVHGVVDALDEVVQGFDQDFDEEQDEQGVFVMVVAGVQVQVVQLVVTFGLPQAVVWWTWQCFEVVVGGGQCLPCSQSTLGQTGLAG